MKRGCANTALIGFGLLIAFLSFWALFNYGGAPSQDQPIISISVETSFITEPLNADGDVDYIEHLNLRFGEGVTPESNAAVEILRIVGPSSIPKALREPLFNRLGMESLPEIGDYFDGYSSHLSQLERSQRIDGKERQLRELEEELVEVLE